MFNNNTLKNIVVYSIKYGRAVKFDKLSIIHKCRVALATYSGVMAVAEQKRRAVFHPNLPYVCILIDGCTKTRADQHFCIWKLDLGGSSKNWDIDTYVGSVTFEYVMQK